MQKIYKSLVKLTSRKVWAKKRKRQTEAKGEIKWLSNLHYQ
jgi:hypothetical protein